MATKIFWICPVVWFRGIFAEPLIENLARERGHMDAYFRVAESFDQFANPVAAGLGVVPDGVIPNLKGRPDMIIIEQSERDELVNENDQQSKYNALPARLKVGISGLDSVLDACGKVIANINSQVTVNWLELRLEQAG